VASTERLGGVLGVERGHGLTRTMTPYPGEGAKKRADGGKLLTEGENGGECTGKKRRLKPNEEKGAVVRGAP